MLFSSITFLYYFLPAVLILYFVVPYRFKNLILLLASLLFYFYGEPVYTALMIISSLSGYIHGLWISKSRDSSFNKVPLVSSIIISVGMLIFYKYIDFFIKNLNWLFNLKISAMNLSLPLGISFYTFQILSYTIDVYRGDAKVQKNLLNFTTYVTLFPQLIAGPIVRYTTVDEELTERKHSISGISYGINRFITGLSKKVLLANTIGELGNIFRNTNEKSVLFYWIAALAFMLQTYYDFSGYSDMAIGLGRIFGFHFPENFNYPFISKSVSEFWRRWHISLGTWFKDYVYIPLGGNRVNKTKWVGNIFIVWFLTGFWHGAEWNFVIWGLYFAIVLLFEKFALKKWYNLMPSIVKHLYTIFLIMISFVIFNGEGVHECISNLKGMFGMLDAPVKNNVALYYLRSYAGVLIIGAFGATPAATQIIKRIAEHDIGKKWVVLLEPVFHALLMMLVTAYLIDGSFNPFLYFRF